MRLHPVTSLLLVGAMLKLAVLTYHFAGLVEIVVHTERYFLQPVDPEFVLGSMTQPMSSTLRELAEVTGLVWGAIWVEGLVRVHGRLKRFNLKAGERKAHA